MSRPVSTRDLRPTERDFVSEMTALCYGRFEYLRIERGELVLDPWPTAVRDLKFGSGCAAPAKTIPADFDLKPQVAELFEYVREVDSGEIRILEIKAGLPFSMEIEHRIEANGGRRHA